MKFSKSLFLAFAGLGLFACSNEDVTDGNNGGIEGPANVEVKVKLPAQVTRSLEDKTQERDVQIDDMKITLTCEDGSTQTAVYEDFLETEVNGEGSVTFERVEAPKLITVSINGYEKNTPLTLEDANGKWKGVKAPMYGETSEIIANPGKNVYTATVNVEHQQARMEFSNIYHQDLITEDNGECRFESINIVGAFLNDWDEENSYNTWEAIKWDNGIWDKIGDDEGVDFKSIKASNSLPGNGKVYAYNVKPGNIPTFTLAFDNIALTEKYQDAHGDYVFVGDHGYAVIDKYKVFVDENVIKNYAEFGLSEAPDPYQSEVEITKLPAGYIYQIQDLGVPDSAIKADMRGEGVNLIATIEVQPWNILVGHAEWK